MASAPSDDGRVVGDCKHRLCGIPKTSGGVFPDILHHPAEPNGIDNLGPFELPWIAEGQPILRKLLLPAVADLLLEKTMLVANAVAECRRAQARHAVHEARRKPAEAAVSESGIRPERGELRQINARARERLTCRIDQTKIDQRIEQKPSNEIFDREVIDPLFLLRLGPAACV